MQEKGRKFAQTYYRTYGEQIPVVQLVRELAGIMQEFTQSGYVHNMLDARVSVCVNECLLLVVVSLVDAWERFS